MANPFAGTTSLEHGGYGAGVAGAATGVLVGRGSDIMDGSPEAILSCVKQVAGLVGSATGPIGGIASVGVGIVCDSIGDGIGAWNTQKTVAALKALLTKINVNGGQEHAALYEIIDYAIGKKTSLRDRKIASATVVAKVGVQAFNAGKFIKKKIQGTQGVNREHYASQLQALAHQASSGDVRRWAREAIIALTKMNMDGLVKQALQESLRSS